MAKINNYKVAYAESPEILEAKVQTLIEDGWQPYGGIESHYDKHAMKEEIYQVMVKYGSIAKKKK